MFIIGGVLLSLVTLQTKAMVSIAQAKERQQATAIANEVLEQLRALPWNSITKGAASYESSDYVSGSQLTIPGEPIVNEPLVQRESAISEEDPAAGSPLDGLSGSNLTLHTDPALPGFEFRAYSFVTRPAGTEDLYNIIVVVEWEPRGKSETRQVVAKTTSFNTRSGCGSDSTRPYASACQDFFVAEGSASAPSFYITGEAIVEEGETPEPGPHEILPGSGISEISVEGASVGVVIESSQSTKVRTTASTGSIVVYDMDGNASLTSGESVSVTASDSVSSSDVLSGSDILPTTLLEHQPDPITNGAIELTIVPGERSGNAESNTDVACDVWALAVHPCGTARASNNKQVLALRVPGEESIPLMELSHSAPSAQVARYPGGATHPAHATYCDNLSGSGCIEAVAKLGQYEANFPGVAKLSSHQLFSAAGRGFHELLRTGNVNSERDRDIQFSWGETVSLDPSEPRQYRSNEPMDPIFESGDTVVTAEPRVSIEPVHEYVENSDLDCQSESCIGRATISAVNVNITYTVTHRGETASFNLRARLGDTSASATYKAAPEAWNDDA